MLRIEDHNMSATAWKSSTTALKVKEWETRMESLPLPTTNVTRDVDLSENRALYILIYKHKRPFFKVPKQSWLKQNLVSVDIFTLPCNQALGCGREIIILTLPH